LITLGRLTLVSASGDEQSLTMRRRHLAVLAVLALSAHPIGRDALIDMFWGEEDEERARHSLSNALSSLRQCLGTNAITARHTDIALSPDAQLDIDATEFSAACEAADLERALALYAGPFLDGVLVQDSARFDGWVTRERARLERQFLQACESRCGKLAGAHRWDDCAALAARWLDALPPSRAAATALLNALAAPGTTDALRAALSDYDRLARRLGREYESPPDPRVAALAAGFREQLRLAAGTVSRVEALRRPPLETDAHSDANTEAAAVMPSGDRTAAAVPPPEVRRRGRRRARGWQLWTAGAVLVAGVGTAFGYHAMSARALSDAAAAQPVVAVTNVTNVRGDTSIAWLEDGLRQMIAADLSHSGAIEVVPPSRVHDVLVRAGYTSSSAISTDQAIDVARRVGATWAVSAEMSHGGDGYIVGVNVFNVSNGKLLRMYTVTGTDIMTVADAAAARVLNVVDASDGAPHFADIATSSSAAYRHFIRGMQASAAGQFPLDEQELDAALALDPGFVSAITARRDIAVTHGEMAIVARMDTAFAQNAGRASDWDRMIDDASRAVHGGGVERGEVLSRQLVARYPKDPRGYEFLSGVLLQHGKWESADSVLIAELNLDSLAVAAGQGPCAPCLAYHGLVESRIGSGHLAAALQAAQKWVALQPELPDAWMTLADALAMRGHTEAAIADGRHAASLTSDPYPAISVGRWLIMGRRYDAAAAYAAKLRSSADPQLRDGADDIAAMVARERGQLRLSNQFLDHILRRPFPDDGMRLVHADNLARLGDFAGARREFQQVAEHGPSDGSHALAGDAARSFAWPHALEADALSASGDTVLLRSIADSLEIVGPRSYYGRDWTLFHHVRGLIAERGGRFVEAEREFRAARWGYAGWTRTLAELANVQLAQGHARQAIATLRPAYVSAPDAMGRYLPRSELDLRMAIAFRAAGIADSASVYASYVRRAWIHADPEVKRLLAQPTHDQ
jgi:DNA-binding SARP family transcriptional activator/tetratricopeptide (TPR) repeat protein/TolB-like protein